jgi:hypothetical protein
MSHESGSEQATNCSDAEDSDSQINHPISNLLGELRYYSHSSQATSKGGHRFVAKILSIGFQSR